MVTNISLIWRMRLALHGVRLSRFAHADLTTVRGGRHVAYRVTMVDGDLIGAETAPLEARVNIRAASFVLRQFGLQVADMRADAKGALLAVDLHRDAGRMGLATRAKARAVGRSVA